MRSTAVLLAAHGIARSYGSVTALSSVDLELHAGEVHGLVGENGAGKSTLVRVLSGMETPDAGTVERSGRLSVVPQYPRMAQSIPVWQNLIVGDEPRRGPFLDAAAGLLRIETIAERYDIALDVQKPASALGSTEIRLAAMLAALVHDPEILILDEPTVGLAVTDQAAILNTLRRFRDHNHGVLYISHDLQEVCDISDRVTPLRHGRSQTPLLAPVSPEHLATTLFGTSNGTPQTHNAGPSGSSGAAILSFESAVIRNNHSGRQCGPLDLQMYPGVITAVTGVRESGLDLLEQYLAGEALVDAGAIRLDGRRLNAQVDPARLRSRDLAYIPSDRFDRAAALGGSVEENAILQERGTVHPRGIRTTRRAQGTTRRLLDTFGIRARRSSPLSALSGGTIQKLILARELDRRPRVCVIAEPTAGLDLQSQDALLELLRDLATTGTAVVILSSSINAVLRLADRVHVIHAGAVAGSFDPRQDEAIARAFAGVSWEAQP